MPRLPIPEFEASFRRHLEPLGFVRRRCPYTLTLDDGRFGWLGINRGTQFGVLQVHPNVGVGHQAIRDLVEAGRPSPPKSGRLPMPVVFVPLHTLMGGGYVSWDFHPGEDIEPKVRDLVVGIEEFGIPFMHRYVTLDDFIGGLQAHEAGSDSEYTLPAALKLAGRLDKATTELRKGLEKRSGRDGKWAESYRQFAEYLVPGLVGTGMPDHASERTGLTRHSSTKKLNGRGDPDRLLKVWAASLAAHGQFSPLPLGRRNVRQRALLPVP